MFDLKDKKAIVCGSTSGIGRAAAMVLAKNGANIILVARNEKKLTETCKMLDSSDGQQHHYIKADFDVPEMLRLGVENYIKEFGGVDILVNNSGGPEPGPVANAGYDEFLSAIRRHLICNQLLVQAVLPGMKEKSFGRIVNIISTSVKAPIPGLGVSNTTRGAVASWAKTLAGEIARFGITVNSVLPGFTATDRIAELFEHKAKLLHKSVEEIEIESLKDIPAGRFAKPEEIAAAVAFLASGEASYVTGTCLTVDGGRTPCH